MLQRAPMVPLFDVSTLLEQERLARNEDLKRKAALRMLTRLHPNNRVTADQFPNVPVLAVDGR